MRCSYFPYRPVLSFSRIYFASEIVPLEQLADILCGGTRLDMDQPGISALRANDREHGFAAGGIHEQRALVGLDGNLAEGARIHAFADAAAEARSGGGHGRNTVRVSPVR